MIYVCIDTNCINARQKDPYLNSLESLYIKGKILIVKTEGLDIELKRGKGYGKGIKKSLSLFKIGSVNDSTAGETKNNNILRSLLIILFGKKKLKKYSNQEFRDATHLATAIKQLGRLSYGSHFGPAASFFVTNDKAILSKKHVFQKEFSIKVVRPKECYLISTKLLKKGY